MPNGNASLAATESTGFAGGEVGLHERFRPVRRALIGHREFCNSPVSDPPILLLSSASIAKPPIWFGPENGFRLSLPTPSHRPTGEQFAEQSFSWSILRRFRFFGSFSTYIREPPSCEIASNPRRQSVGNAWEHRRFLRRASPSAPGSLMPFVPLTRREIRTVFRRRPRSIGRRSNGRT